MAAALGARLLAVGLVCNHWLPINKKLWTSSFALFMAGLDFVLFAGFAWLVDVLGWKQPVRPFVILGMNSIAVYMVSELLDTLLYMGDARDVIDGRVRAARLAGQRVAALRVRLHARHGRSGVGPLPAPHLLIRI